MDTLTPNVSGNPGSVSQDEAEKFQHSLTQRQQIIDEKKQSQSQALNKRSFEFMDDLQKKLKDFLREYNKGKKYSLILSSGTGLDYMVYKDSTLNISGDVIKGMNEKMSAYSKR